MNDILLQAKACLNCPNPRCAAHCPCGNSIPAIISKIKEEDLDGAAELLAMTNPFPELTSVLCDHQRQCRGSCVRGIRGEPVDFPSMEFALANKVKERFFKPVPSNGKKVLIVGAGPSALSAASFLLCAGFAVEIHEKEDDVGGAILTGIPSFRFDKSVLQSIRNDLSRMGCRFQFNHEVTRQEIQAAKGDFDFILLGLGAEKPNGLNAPSCPNIYQALDILKEANLGQAKDKYGHFHHAIVMGGGNVAMDVSRTLVRLGSKVTLIYRRDEASMPAQKIEIAEAKADGVIFNPLTNVAGYQQEDDMLTGLTLVDMALGEKDESGRPSFSVIEGSEHDAPCDAFVMAIGEKSGLPDFIGDMPLGLEERTLAIGDCSYGAKNIAAAIKAGREAALKIIDRLN